MKILLVGNGPRYNRGCEALSLSTLALLKQHYPGADFELLSFHPEEDRIFSNIDKVNVFPLTLPYETPPLFWRITNKFGFLPQHWQANRDNLIPYVERLKNADLVLSLGGDNYSDDYGGAGPFWDLGKWSKKLGKPFVIWGGSVGPFRSESSRQNAIQGLQSVDLVTAREDSTIRYLHELGYKGKAVRVFDSAFLLEPVAALAPTFSRNAPVVGFNISPIFHRYSAGKTPDEILDETRAFLKKILPEFNILLIPHVFSNRGIPGDEDYMAPLLSLGENIAMLPVGYDSRQIKSVIGGCNYFVGARTHATIAAFSQKIPTISLAYSMKAVGINLDIFGHENFLLAAQDYSADRLFAAFHYLCEHKTDAVAALAAKMTEAQTMVEKGRSALDDLMKNRT